MLRKFPPHIAMLACAGLICLAQTNSSPHFEVASIKALPGGSFGPFSGGPGSSDPERATYEGTTLDVLIREAYHVEPYQLSGPAWLRTEFYRVSAKLAPGATPAEYRQMMANLLAERFGLTFHRVMKDFRGYEIAIAKGGPRLAPSTAPTGQFPEFDRTSGDNGRLHYTFTNTTMSVLTNRLSIMMRMRVPVVDRTGIDGRFDFTLDVESPPADAAAGLDDNSAAISAAMQSQLGLKLNPVKIPLEVLVVDHVGRAPSSN